MGALLVAAGRLVVVYDQPGHGLSSGARADIGSFGDYTAVLEAVFRQYAAHRPLPCDVTTHSMGGGIVVDYLLRRNTPAPVRVVQIMNESEPVRRLVLQDIMEDSACASSDVPILFPKHDTAAGATPAAPVNPEE